MTPSATGEQYMRRCLELARKGFGLTRQNPLVGSVIVYEDRIIGEGYHHEYGGPHAEVLAIGSVKDRFLLKKSTLYVNLEPCSHFGKTPPCAVLIEQVGIPKVVVGCLDPNPEVSGNGIKFLRNAGIEVEIGLLEKESRFLNRRFITFHEKKRPYVIIKWAQTLDGFIDRSRLGYGELLPSWITNHTARMLVHKWRSEETGIMVGTETALMDNPELTVRDWPGINPVRIIPDKNGRLFEGLKIMNNISTTIIFTSDMKKVSENQNYVYFPHEKYYAGNILQELYNKNISSVFVEGGAKLINSFIQSGLWDEIFMFTGNKKFITGVEAPVLNLDPDEVIDFRGSKLNIFRKKSH